MKFKFVLPLLLSLPGVASAACDINEDGYVVLSGSYICAGPCAKPGGAAYIVQNGAALTFVNEVGQTTTGSITQNGSIHQTRIQTGWGVNGTLKNACTEIFWDSGSTSWIKQN